MTPKQAEFWKPYTELIGIENFHLIKGEDGLGETVYSKHYCGIDTSNLGTQGEMNRNVAIRRYYLYQELLAKEDLTANDISRIFVSYVDKNFFDSELIYILTQYHKVLSLLEHWDLIINCWCRQEFTTGGERSENWRKVFSIRERPASLTETLPDTFMAYRAGSESGFSWSLDIEVAKWFHKRFEFEFGKIPFLKKSFQRSDVIFYTNRRNEQEVVIIS